MLKYIAIAWIALLEVKGALALEVRGFTLNETQLYPYDAAPAGDAPTHAQKAVLQIRDLGARHVILSPFARMNSVDSNAVVPVTLPGAARAQERERYLRLIRYIHSLGLTVGLRPMLNVAENGPQNWHGNIRPSDPAAWFESFRSYLDIYANIARAGEAEEFTLGVELYSMTVGVEDQWPQQPFGFPREWLLLSRDLRAKLGPQIRLMYDIHVADSKVSAGGDDSGGELERWRYRLADLRPDPRRPFTMDPASRAAWELLRDLWLSFDAIGIDVYRSLWDRAEPVPPSYEALVARLGAKALRYAADIDAKLSGIERAVDRPARVIIKEIGYRSCTACFVDPFSRPDARAAVNEAHQAAAYQAFFEAFVKPRWRWLEGVAFWEVSTDPARAGPRDTGFSPLGKPRTESVLRAGWDL